MGQGQPHQIHTMQNNYGSFWKMRTSPTWFSCCSLCGRKTAPNSPPVTPKSRGVWSSDPTAQARALQLKTELRCLSLLQNWQLLGRKLTAGSGSSPPLAGSMWGSKKMTQRGALARGEGNFGNGGCSSLNLPSLNASAIVEHVLGRFCRGQHRWPGQYLLRGICPPQ